MPGREVITVIDLTRDPPREVIDLTGDDDPMAGQPEVIDLTREDDVIDLTGDEGVRVVAGQRNVSIRRGAVQEVTSAADFDAAVVDLTMEDEDEQIPPGFWDEVLAQKGAQLRGEDLPRAIPEIADTHRAMIGAVQAEIARRAVAQMGMQQVVIPNVACYYAFTDNIEYRHVAEEFAPPNDDPEPAIDEEGYEEGNWPPREGYHALITLDCFEADYFLRVLAAHAETFEMLFGATLTEARIDARRRLLNDLLADEGKSWIIRIMVGSENREYSAIHEFFRELQWRKIWIEVPPPDMNLSLWDMLEDRRATDIQETFIASDLFTDATAYFGYRPDPTITPQEIAWLEEVFSLNHIPDAPLPPTTPVGGIPNEPLNGFDFLATPDPYWQSDGLPADLGTTIAADRIRPREDHLVFADTQEEFTIHYLKKNFVLLKAQSGSFHTCLFLADRVMVRRAFRFEDYLQNRRLRQRLALGVIEAGSLMSDERVLYVVDRRTRQIFIGLRLSDELGYFFVALDHAMLVKKQPS